MIALQLLDLMELEPHLQTQSHMTQQQHQTNFTANLSRFGTVEGEETVTFTGTGFPTSINDVTIIIYGVNFAVQTASETQITSTTTKRPGYVFSSL